MMMAGAVVYSRREEEESDSRNVLEEEPTGFTINWMCSVRERLAFCRIANLLAQHIPPASILTPDCLYLLLPVESPGIPSFI